MKFSTRSTYGMRALVELALAGGHGPVSASVIAKRQVLSVPYLEQLLHRLKKEGLIGSVRGPRGGYVLARDPSRITIAEVVRTLDGDHDASHGAGREAPGGAAAVSPRLRPLEPNGGLNRQRAALSKEAQRQAQRVAEAVWRCVHDRIAQSLDAVTLQDLCDEVRAASGEPLEHRYVFHI